MALAVRFAGVETSGEAVDLRESSVDPESVAAAVRDPADDRVDCPEPGPVHEHVGLVGPGMAVSLSDAIAAAVRSVGESAPQDGALAAVRTDLAGMDLPPVDLSVARRRVAEAGADEAALREEVARLRGALQARRAVDADPEDAADDLRNAVRRLSTAETERLAAEQALDRAREAARDALDARARRLRLQDRERNLARAARDHLVESHAHEFAEAIRAVPVSRFDADARDEPFPDPGDGPDEFDGDESPTEFGADDVTAALAVARMAALDAPVVLACDRFESAEAARDCLGAPVVKV